MYVQACGNLLDRGQHKKLGLSPPGPGFHKYGGYFIGGL